MANTGNLVKWYPPVSDKLTPQEVVLHTRLLYNSSNDHDQAITLLKEQIADLEAIKPTNTVITITQTVLSTQFPGLGTKNDQTGNTSYTTQTSDNGTMLILNDSSPVSVTLNSVVTPPYFLFVTNFGSGVVTLTPSSGTINGASSIQIPEGYFGEVVFDGINWSTSAIISSQGMDFTHTFMLMGA